MGESFREGFTSDVPALEVRCIDVLGFVYGACTLCASFNINKRHYLSNSTASRSMMQQPVYQKFTESLACPEHAMIERLIDLYLRESLGCPELAICERLHGSLPAGEFLRGTHVGCSLAWGAPTLTLS